MASDRGSVLTSAEAVAGGQVKAHRPRRRVAVRAPLVAVEVGGELGRASLVAAVAGCAGGGLVLVAGARVSSLRVWALPCSCHGPSVRSFLA